MFIRKKYKLEEKWMCPICHEVGNQCVGTIHSLYLPIEKHEIIECFSCKSLYYAGESPVVGYENSSNNKNYWQHYVQLGAGLTAMLEPLFYLGDRAKGSLLDIGCGFGYVVDFYNKIGYGNAVGLETAEYGKIGAKLLGAPIINSYYTECHEISGKKFDIIFSCEVLEHVPNPQAFIDEISVGLKEEGILVLTTPSSNVINTNTNEAAIVGSLSPDYHYFLSSPEALKNLLHRCGYKDIRVDDSGSRLYAWASKSKLPPLQKQMPWKDYFQYLQILSENADPNVKSGALQRLFKDSWNTGHFDLAGEAYRKLEDYASKHYNLCLKYPDIKRYNIRESIIANIENHPAWYASVLYFGGLYIGTTLKDYACKARMINAALEIIQNEVKCQDPRYVQESQYLFPYVNKSLSEVNSRIEKGPIIDFLLNNKYIPKIKKIFKSKVIPNQ